MEKKDDRLEIIQARNYKVVKGNDIIQKARYDLGLAEIKAFSFVLSTPQFLGQSLQIYIKITNSFPNNYTLQTIKMQYSKLT